MRALKPALAVCLFVLMTVPPVHARSADKKKEEKPAEAAPEPRRQTLGVEYFRTAVDLDKSQEEKMRQLLSDYNKEKIKREGDIRFKELEFKELANQETLDFDKLEARYKEITDLQAGVGSFRVKKLLSAREFLNDEQYDKYKRKLLKMFFQ